MLQFVTFESGAGCWLLVAGFAGKRCVKREKGESLIFIIFKKN